MPFHSSFVANSKIEIGPLRRGQINFSWNGHIVAMGASMGGIDALAALLPSLPANCPPLVVALQAEPAVVEAFIAQIGDQAHCSVRAVKDGAQLVQGTVHLAVDPARHVVVEPGTPPRLRLLDREPVEGARPSANLLFGTIARAGIPAAGIVLTGMGEDGAKGLKLLQAAGGATLVQDPATAIVSEAPAAAIAAGAADRVVPLEQLAAALCEACSTA